MKLIYILLFITPLFSCQKKKLQLLSKDVTINDIGKIGFSYQDIKFISKEFGIEKKFLNSCIYVNSKNETICYPINDSTFNYDYYQKYHMSHPLGNFKARIFYKTKTINSQKINLVFNMEILEE